MTPRFVISVAGAAIVAAASSACSGGSPAPMAATATSPVPQAKVTVNHQDQNNLGPITCDLTNFDDRITIQRNNKPMAFVHLTQKQGNAPEVRSLSLKYIEGANLRVQFLAYDTGDWAATGPNAPAAPTVRVTGTNYRISGYAWNSSDYHIPIEIDVTCP